MTFHVTAGFEALGTAPHVHRLCVWSRPVTAAPVGLVVYVHPFAEEMNKSRRMAGLQSRALASAGFAVLQADLLGCGDSAGDSGDASWAAWVDDVVAACRLVRLRFAQEWPGRDLPPLWLWGLRSGCLLAVEAARRLDESCDFVFWQPVLAGKTLLQQFLRLDSVGAAIGKSGSVPREPALVALAAGRTAFVAGYAISPALASGLQSARLAPPARPGRIHWFEIAPQSASEPFPAVRHAWADWQQAGFALASYAIAGRQFWQTAEIEDAPMLIEATLAACHGPALVRGMPRPLPLEAAA